MMTTYTNPILRGMRPDPSIVRVADTYYLVNSTFEYYPGISLSKSTDLLNWQPISSVVTTTAQADLTQAKSNEGIFAVCIRYFAGAFYVITTNFAEFKSFIIRGVLNDAGEICWDKNRVELDIMGIDPDLYFEAGKTFVQFTGYIDKSGTKAIQQVEINLTDGTILHGPKVISYGTGGRDVEGPHIIKKNQIYYLLTAEGGTGVGHMITIFKSDSLWGPFKDSNNINPIFTNRDRADEPLQNIGHADLFQDQQDNWWLTCLGTRPATVGFTQITNLGRETLLYPVTWNNTWPQIYNGIPSQTVDLTNFPKHAAVLPHHQKLKSFVDTFDHKQLSPEWISLRNSLGTDLVINNGVLTLHGRETTLSQATTPAFIGLRQTEQHELFKITLDSANTVINSGKIGIASLINTDHYAAILVEKKQNNYKITRYQKVADLEVTTVLGTTTELPTVFEVSNQLDTKTFRVITKSEEFSFTTSSLHFSNEAIAALNTGDIQGLYAIGDAQLAIKQAERKTLTD
ncbi:glycoside hydrolase family 43 protein [Loigolactobacillus jiayinensis]|uniref:Family 43 glycosylhydrolase n=1 Tax=Loigolactobacillus jiayinensis TaxID=2486016 RepID=A0ABW1R9M9_9LACO|nr:glycoside hydrolase family 43 protein [Loigolactobacillus jiayinensis]